MSATLTPIHHRQSSVRSGTVMLFGNPPGVTPIHRQALPRTGTVMLFGNPPPAARPRPSTALEGGASA